MPRQHLAEAVEGHFPGTEIADQRLLESGAEARHRRAALPARALGSALESVAALEVRMLRLHVPETRDVNRVGTTSDLHPILRPRQLARRAASHDVVHQVVAELAARVAQSRRKFRRQRVEQNARGFESSGAKEDDLRLDL